MTTQTRTASAADTYLQRAKQFRSLRDLYHRRWQWMGLLRLITFAAFAWQLVVFFQNHFQTHSIVYALSALAAFFVFLFISFGYQRHKKYYEQLLQINENELAVMDGRRSFLADGTEYKAGEGFASDLNVFGPGSLYHQLNRSATLPGRDKLAAQANTPFVVPETIVAYQQAVKELGPRIDFRQTLLARGLLIGKEEGLKQLLEGIDRRQFDLLTHTAVRLLSWIWPFFGCVILTYSIVVNRYQLLLLFLVCGLLLAALFVRKTGALYNHISKKSYLYGQYAVCFQTITGEIWLDDYLRTQQRQLADAEHAFQRLSRLVNWFDIRLNVFLSPFANGLFLSDLVCALAYLKWNGQYQQRVPGWFDTLGEIEVLNSLATFHYNHPRFVFPQPEYGPLHISATSVGHPLMNETKAVLNDISLGDEGTLQLITGSNMSGKSTYLRTVGLNLLLAQMGAPVFAGTFSFSPMQIRSSFHHIDSLEESTSYFYAELKSLQRIIRSLDGPVPSLVLLDEVMRGTNSKDKHDGTELLISKLMAHNCLTMIATHDTELGVLADKYPGKVRNYHFESELAADGLHFDFKRKPGVARMTNATYLMKQMGII
ncbi:MutS-related protein [Sediminibacterium soli]|uniref:MutS-related protein n=1 Tax=Sediminibacterium soli TaxID=2698829 RepID=UPI00137ABB4D|nr:hypothetical protein [Sediminibacterium soli]NCI47211.1 hypothetical protein [Sediminibacterium soli]